MSKIPDDVGSESSTVQTLKAKILKFIRRGHLGNRFGCMRRVSQTNFRHSKDSQKSGKGKGPENYAESVQRLCVYT